MAYKRWRLAGFALVIIGAGAAVVYLKFNRDLKDLAKTAIRQMRIIKNGQEGFVQRQVEAQNAKQPANTASNGQTSIIETAVLPLRVLSTSIGSATPFPVGAGSMTRVEDRLIIMDRLGGFYSTDGVNIKTLALPKLPNGLADFIQHSENTDLSMDTFRTHSVHYSARDGRLYASYERYVDPAHNRFEISAISFDPTKLSYSGAWTEVFKTVPFPAKTYGLAGGGKIISTADRIYFSVGDYGFYADKNHPYEHAAQDPNGPFGKIFEILPNGKVSMISRGHRNTQGLVFSTDRQLINVEQGPQGGDELNIIEQGKNYGWPIETYGTDYGRYTWEFQLDNSNRKLQAPLYSFVPSVAADTIIQIDRFSPRWHGDFLVGSLKAQTIFRMKIQDSRVTMSEPIWIGHRVRELVELPDRVVALTDDGLLLTLTVDKAALDSNNRAVDTVTSAALSKCMACHHTGPTNPSHLAPSLSGLDKRDIGTDTFLKYSAGMKAMRGKWDAEKLAAFLKDPASVVPGTAMPRPDISDDELKDILHTLLDAAAAH